MNRGKTEQIRRLQNTIINLRERIEILSNELQSVNRNEQAKKYCPFCGSENHYKMENKFNHCDDCLAEWAI